MPYHYIGFEKKYGVAVELVTFTGTAFFTICLGVLSIVVFGALYELFCHALNLKDVSTNRGWKDFTSQLAFTILFVPAILSTSSVIIRYVPSNSTCSPVPADIL